MLITFFYVGMFKAGGRYESSSVFIVYLFLFFPLCVFGQNKPPVQLANVYSDSVFVQDFLISEKYDGVRAVWKNGQLQTRNGNPIHAPEWFISSLPNMWLDGELWSKRQDFEFISSVVSKHVPIDEEWKKLTYMVFDAPNSTQTFQQRVDRYTQLVNDVSISYIKPVLQHRVKDNAELLSLLKEYVDAGSEGVILHRADALFGLGRTGNVLKLKPYMDAEAVVLAHVPGKGKYTGMMGALKVRLKMKSIACDSHGERAVIFKIGSGFTDEERKSPPKIGDTITFTYHGLSKNNIPRFASFLRERREE